MDEKVNFAMVGAFVLVLGTALIAGILWFSSGKSYRTTYDTYQAYLEESVSGLNLNAPVRYRGVDVGRVRKIMLAPGNVEQVRLMLSIERGTPIKADTVAVLRTQGLTGIAYVELTGGSRDAPALKIQGSEEYPTLKTGPSLMTRLDTSVTTLLASLNKNTEGLSAVMDADNRRALKSIMADLSTLSHALAGRSAAIDAGLTNAARTMENTARLTNDLPQLTLRLQRSADSFDRMAADIGRASANANGMIDGTRAGVQQFTGETLPELNQLVAELRELTGSLRRVSTQLEQNPSVLLYGKPAAKPGPGE